MILKFFWRIRDNRRRTYPRVAGPVWLLGRWHRLTPRGMRCSNVQGNRHYLEAAYDEQMRPYAGSRKGFGIATRLFTAQRWKATI